MPLSHTMTLVHPALRTEQLGFSDIVKIRNRVLALKQSGVSVLQLEGGEPYSPTPAFIKDAMKAALDADQTRYAPSSGIPSLLTAIKAKLAEKNGITADESNLIVVSGGMHGLFCAFQVSVNPGDEVVFFSPYWTPIKDQVTYASGVPVRIPWAEVRGGELEKALQKRLTPRTRVLYVNSPANPTGDVLGRGQLETIARFAIANNLVVISDEAYEDLIYDGEHVSIASLPGMFSRTISVYTLSKSYAMTGWRIGYICADASLMNVIKKLVLNTINGISTPTQFAAAAAIADRSGHMAAMREQYRIRRDLLVHGLHEAGFDCAPPAGAFYLFADVRKRLGGDSWKAMNELLERTGIATVPGVVFGPEGEGFLRMSYSNPIETLERVGVALKRL